MFGFLKKDQRSQLNKKYMNILEQAQQAQRNGDIEGYSRLSAEAETVLKQIDELEPTKT